MLDKNLIISKIKFIKDDLEHLLFFRDYSQEEIIADFSKHATVERLIERIVNEAIDINQHIIVESGKGDEMFDFKGSFLLLAKLKVYPQKFAEQISESVGLRNILVHHYRELDERKFFKAIKKCLVQYTKYCGYILKFLSKRKRD